MQPDPKDRTAEDPTRVDDARPQDRPQHWEPDPEAGLAREVGDLDDPDAENEGALPGRAGGGLAGG